MTRERTHGQDSDFGAWFRSQPLLHSHKYHITMSDVDFSIRRYEITAPCGWKFRDMVLMMNIEVKSFGALPKFPQTAHIYLTHQRLTLPQRLVKEGRSAVHFNVRNPPNADGTASSNFSRLWHFGYSIVTHDAGTIQESTIFSLSRFADNGTIVTKTIDRDMLVEVLGMRVDPDTLRTFNVKRGHHGEFIKVDVENRPLFPVTVETRITY